MTEKKNLPWWKNAVVYQIYPKSFQDSNGGRNRRYSGNHKQTGLPRRSGH